MRKATLPTFSLGRLSTLYNGWFKQDNEEERTHFVQGKKATLNEYNEAKALEIIGLDFQFQLSLAGGRTLAFGIVLDFLVETVPLPTPLWVHIEYWHYGPQRERDMLQMSLIEEYLGFEVAPPVELWGDQTDTVEKALLYTRLKLGIT